MGHLILVNVFDVFSSHLFLMVGMSLPNCVPFMLRRAHEPTCLVWFRITCQHVLYTHVFTCLRVLRGYISTCLSCIPAYVPNMTCVFSSSPANVPWVLTCLACLFTHAATCLASSHSCVLTCLESFTLYGLCEHVFNYQHVCLRSK